MATTKAIVTNNGFITVTYNGETTIVDNIQMSGIRRLYKETGRVCMIVNESGISGGAGNPIFDFTAKDIVTLNGTPVSGADPAAKAYALLLDLLTIVTSFGIGSVSVNLASIETLIGPTNSVPATQPTDTAGLNALIKGMWTAIAQSGVQFTKDGFSVYVNEDTSTPAANIPLPVKLSGVTGDVIINAGDLSVSVNHVNDSIRIGNGNQLTPYFLEIDSFGNIGTVLKDAAGNVFGTVGNPIFTSATVTGNTTGGNFSVINISNVTAAQFPANACKRLKVQASDGNAGKVWVGFNGVTSITGEILYPTWTTEFTVSNTNLIYVLSENGTEDINVSFEN